MSMKKMKTYPPSKMCNDCGNCFRSMPGHYSPNDFEDLSFEGLKTEIDKGRIAIDWWEGDYGPEYYLRARHDNENIVHGSWGGMCVNLRSDGCILPFEGRPLGCRALKPRDTFGGRCNNSYSKKDCKNDWRDYADVLKRLVVVYKKEQGNSILDPYKAFISEIFGVTDK